jgi:hypothetical protein
MPCPAGSRGRDAGDPVTLLAGHPRVRVLIGVLSLLIIGASAWLLLRGLPQRRLIVVGIDGGDWSVIRPLMAEGAMPNMAEIVRHGASGELRALEDYVYSPPSWTSIATGKTVAKHGVTTVVPRAEVRATPFWEAATRFGRRVCVINWICNYGAQMPEGSALISGPYMVSMSPPDLEQRVARLVGEYRSDIYPRQMSSGFLENAIALEEQRARVALDLLRDRHDLFAVTFTSTDRLSHFFWLYHEPAGFDVPPGELERQGDVIREMYRKVDEYLGRIMSAMDDRTNLIVVSDHGFQANPRKRLEYSHLQPNALLERAGLTRTGTFGEAIPEESVAWEDPQALAGDGPLAVELAPGKEGRLSEIRELLASLRIGEDQDPIFHDFAVEGRRLTFHAREGSFAYHDTARFTDGERSWTVPAQLLVDHNHVRSGIHRPQGIVALYGPDIRRGVTIRDATVLDIAPTALYLCGLPVAEDMDGRILLEYVVLRHRLINRPYTVPTYERVRSAPAASPEQAVRETPAPDANFDEEVEAKLRALGYVK